MPRFFTRRRLNTASAPRLCFESLESKRLLAADADWFQVVTPSNPPVLSLAADADGDGQVGLGDFGILKANYGQNFGDQTSPDLGDFDGDGVVGLADFGILKTTYGQFRETTEAYPWDGGTYEKVNLQWIVQVAPTVGDPAAAQALLDPSVTILQGLGEPGHLLVQTESDDPAYLANLLGDDPDVLAFEPNTVVEAQYTPTDALFSQQWGHQQIGAETAWDFSFGSEQMVVAVIDSGIDLGHDDLTANLWINRGEADGAGPDGDNNSFVGDLHGFDFVNNDGNPQDDTGHGTHVSGTIGAVEDGVSGIVGVSPRVSLMSLKVLGADNRGSAAGVASAVNYATMMKAGGDADIRVINLSLVSDFPSTSVEAAIAAAAHENILVVAAAGNDGRDTDATPTYPASFPLDNIISVGNSDMADNRAPSSNFGATSVDIFAPGTQILSTVHGSDGHSQLTGTSMAAPHVSGAAILLATRTSPGVGERSYASIRDSIFSTATSVPALSGLAATGGRLNLAGAIDLVDSNVELRPMFFMPEWTGGTDPDFSANGPNVDITTEIRISSDSTKLEAQVSMFAGEDPAAGDTIAAGTSSWETVYVAPHGRLITSIAGPTNTAFAGYNDTDWEADIFELGDGDLVDRFEFVGDTDGDDAGGPATPPEGKTGMRVHFNRVDVTLTPEISPSGSVCHVGLAPLYLEPGDPNDPLYTPGLDFGWIRGDDDFASNGPRIDSYVELRLQGGNIEGRAYLHAAEHHNGASVADHTTFDGWSPWTLLYDGVDDVTQIYSPMQFNHAYRDRDDNLDSFGNGVGFGTGLVHRLTYEGDASGSDRPSMLVDFKDVLVQQASCETARTIQPRPQFFHRLYTSDPGTLTPGSSVRVSPDGTRVEAQFELHSSVLHPPFGVGEVGPWQTIYVAPEGRTIVSIDSAMSSSSGIAFANPWDFNDDRLSVFETANPNDLISTSEVVIHSRSDDLHVRWRTFFNPIDITLSPVDTVLGDTMEIDLGVVGLDVPSIGISGKPDDEFEGNGPLFDQFAELRISPSGKEVEARVYVHAAEWLGTSTVPNNSGTGPAPDFTAFDGWSGWEPVSTAEIPSGFRIKRILSPLYSRTTFVHGGVSLVNLRSPTTSDFVQATVFYGDRDSFPAIDGDDDPVVEVRMGSVLIELEPDV